MKHTEVIDGALYNIRNMRLVSPPPYDPNLEGWYGTRKDGTPYYKTFQGGADVFRGNDKLRTLLKNNPHLKAFPAKRPK